MITLLTRHNRRRGFTITELLVVIGLIVLLIGILLPALAAVKSGGLMTKSMANMRQIATWMRLYSSDNREFILPSQFDYSDNSYPGKVRSIISVNWAQSDSTTKSSSPPLTYPEELMQRTTTQHWRTFLMGSPFRRSAYSVTPRNRPNSRRTVPALAGRRSPGTAPRAATPPRTGTGTDGSRRPR
ncbi:MAG: prepilin-type N-terminal cleavage/methylation domain-containing protein [Planctomycetes bacterium]|nr:prepilin-type N-terminal cleavage/methylation domain-containing protein [Planctomycetota bacterium]